MHGIAANRVRELMADAVARIRAEASGEFTRQWLRDFFAEYPDVSAQAAEAMVHSFWRTVHPSGAQGLMTQGRHRLPDYAAAAVEHRDWRMTSGRLSLPDVIQLHRLMAGEKNLSPGLAELRSRMNKALRALRVPRELWA